MSMGVWAHEHEQFVEDSLKMIKDDISGKEINFSFQYAMFNTISTGLCATDFSHDCTENTDLYRPAPSVSRTQKLLQDTYQEMTKKFSAELYSDYVKYASSLVHHCAAIHYIMDEHYPLKGVPYIERLIFVLVTQPVLAGKNLETRPDESFSNATDFFVRLLELTKQYQNWLLQTVEVEGNLKENNVRIKVEDSEFMIESRNICIGQAENQPVEEERYRSLFYE